MVGYKKIGAGWLARVTVAALSVVLLWSVQSAEAASCWYHNNSLMRLEDSGQQRWMYYANPKPSLRRSGVRHPI